MTEQMQYFGYGSLVNRNTRPVSEGYTPATVPGWRRCWGHRVNHVDAATTAQNTSVLGYSVLTVQRADGSEIDGVQVSIPLVDLPELDAREGGYNRHEVGTMSSRELVAMYVSKTENNALADKQYPLLQSYVDCVMAGFLTVFGNDGLTRFMHSTSGWDAPMLNDRSAPLYQRAVTLPPDLLAHFDKVAGK